VTVSQKFVPCRVRQLPPPGLIEAAKRAVRLNPANALAGGPARAAMPPLPPEHLAALTGKLWPAGGVRLTVSFLDGPDRATRDKILSHANAWSRTANVLFTEVPSGGQVRIARTAGQGYWSYLGTDILSIPGNEPTMNLESFDAGGTPDSEFYRVVRHEFGHTLSWPHEHTRKEIVGRIDPRAAEAYFLRYDGWDAETVRQQVLTVTPDEEITALPTDVRSIMAYGLPAEIMKDHIAVPGGNDIDDEDYQLAAKVYPKSDTGGGGGGGPAPGGKLFTLTFRQPVRKGGRVTFSTPVAIPQGRYDFVPESAAGHAEVEAEVS
jgi:hypothetical protein